ncbi:MAG: GDSL-type esterase/lipase family protein [Phycisphaerae bacterium]|nr:GDSL-type esterase/lipase family protein [Phycisphaerae bacterium]
MIARFSACCCGLMMALTLLAAAPASQAALKLEKGDHICFIGDALADRMQHHGWLETYMQAAMPELELVIRNQGYAGDRVNSRPRNKGFMDAHSYLSHSKTDVIFAFFGYNESYDNKPEDHRKNLVKWIDETLGKNYSGKGAPRIVLFSPIAHEDLGDPNMPDGKANNQRLAAYAQATAAAAKEKGVSFVDLFGASQALYAKSSAPLTLNGIHLTSAGNRQVAGAIMRSLYDRAAPTGPNVEKTRTAVLDKNWHWFNRYRATDGNDVWGSRAKLHGNRATLQRELEQLDAMAANRDQRIWAVAGGGDKKIDDSNVPKALEVKSNFRKDGKTGSLTHASPTEAVSKLRLAKDLKANVFASEEMFPELVNPVQLGVDTKGRLWAAAWKTYPKWEPTKKMDDRLLIFPDENRDGVADKAITFAYVHNPTGFEFWNGGVIVASAPDILFLKDTDGDDVADVRIRVLHGIDSADTHHTANNFVYGPGGYIYYQRGVFHVSNVETPWKTAQKSGTSGMYRFNPRTYEFSFHANNSPNPHGISFDYWGYHYATDGTGGRAYQVKPNGKGGFSMRGLLKKTVRPVPSSGILSSAHFPERNNGNFLICNAIGFLGIKQYTLAFNTENGDANGTEIEDLLVSDDRNFRPTDFEIGDDGGVYVSDWANPIVGHMQHNIRDPARDHEHGRIFRITHEGRPLSKHVAVDGQPIEKLLDLLKHPVNGIRHRTRVELSERDTKAVIAAAQKWVKQFDPKKKEDAHHILEILWLHQQHNVVNRPLLDQVLQSPEPHARIAAKTVQQFWKDR